MLHVCPHNGLTCVPGHSAAGRAGARNGASAIARLPPPLERRGGALRSRWHGAAGRSSRYSRCAGHLCRCLGCSDGGSAHFIAQVAARPQVAKFLRHCLVSVVQMGCRWQQLRRQHGAMRCTASAAAQMARCWLPAVSCASCLPHLPTASMVLTANTARTRCKSAADECRVGMTCRRCHEISSSTCTHQWDSRRRPCRRAV